MDRTLAAVLVLTTAIERKIGCDRGSPACNNCLRTGRECLGYNIRLAWPDQPDGRRRVSQLPGQATQLPPINAQDYGNQFLNVTYSDLLKSRNGYADRALALALAHEPPTPRLKHIVAFVPDLREREAHLLDYCKSAWPCPALVAYVLKRPPRQMSAASPR